jgi:hypothetical protein
MGYCQEENGQANDRVHSAFHDRFHTPFSMALSNLSANAGHEALMEKDFLLHPFHLLATDQDGILGCLEV